MESYAGNRPSKGAKASSSHQEGLSLLLETSYTGITVLLLFSVI